jgi:hypothetical protein
MKKRNAFKMIAVVGVLLTVLVLAGCPLDEEETVSITQRVQNFVSDLNTNYDNVYLNWHPDTTTRQAAANPATLESGFPSSEIYTVSNISADESAGTATATITSNVTYGDSNGSASFTMRKDGESWFINSLRIAELNLSSFE